jgi:hypothetical protein
VRRLRPIAVATSLLLLAAACNSSSGKRGAATATTVPKANAAPVPLGAVAVDVASQTRCDPISAHCPFPLPNDHFTVVDSTTPTGRRLALDRASMPANTKGVHVDVTDQNRADGWSPGSTMLVQLDGVDLVQSHAPTIADQQHSLDPDSPIVVLDATTGARHPFWAELDANADARTQPVLIMHPTRNFPDGHRIVVAMRNLVDLHGAKLAPSPAFASYRDGQRTTDATFEARRADMERIFSDLARAGVGRADLQLAWDFTVASTQSLTGRLIAIRDDAFRSLGSSAPSYTVDKVTDNPDPHFIRRVE